MNFQSQTKPCSAWVSRSRRIPRQSLGLTVLVLLLIASAAHAELVWIEPDGGDGVTTIKLTVTPAPEPDPAFKYRLTVRPIDEKPGNAAVWYFRALANEGTDFSDIQALNREIFGEAYDEWPSPSMVPLSDLPLDDAKEAFSRFNTELLNLHEASRRQGCNWDRGIESIRGPELIAVLLPEIQQMRSFGWTLALGSRIAVAEQRYDDAIDLLRINYRMAQHTATEPFLINQLVGIAISGVGNDVLLDLIASSDSPNMYWALSELPSPLISLRSSLRFELEIGERIFPFLVDAETATHAPDEWRSIWVKAFADLTTLESRPGSSGKLLPMQLGVAGLAMLNYSHAKDSLIAQGFDPEQIEQMPVGQVLAIYSKRTYERIAQAYEKATLVSFTEAGRFEEEARQLISQANVISGGPGREFIPIASALLPAVSAARYADIRLQRNFAALRVIEAVRMHAAENDGQLPKKLNEVTCVPVPANPATGQPFAYYREGKTAVLELPKSDGLHYATRYEITIAE